MIKEERKKTQNELTSVENDEKKNIKDEKGKDIK